MKTASLLAELDPSEHRRAFEFALYDPNPQISHVARKLTKGKGYSRVTSRPRPPGQPGPRGRQGG